MAGLVHAPIGPVGDSLVVLDAGRRLYAGLSREGEYWHVVQPARAGDPRVTAEPPLAAVGDLVCTCRGGVFHGTCYRTDEAKAWERADASGIRRPVWALPREALEEGTATFDAPVGAGEGVEASRG